jgi:hypothetical protein
VIGAFLVANSDWSRGALVVVAYGWLIGYGFITVVAALALRMEPGCGRYGDAEPPMSGSRRASNADGDAWSGVVAMRGEIALTALVPSEAG